MINFLNKIVLLFLLIFNFSVACFGRTTEGDEKLKKDTITALVIAPSNPFYISISKLSGEKIISMIDSLLELDYIPKSFIKEFKAYVESKLLDDDSYNTLTNYYDNSEIPSNCTYETWDTKNISPYDESIFVEHSIKEVWETLFIAFGLVVLSIYFFLHITKTDNEKP